MARLVTLAQAKLHLRVDGDARNADIDLKLLQASDIVLSYLKSRANATATITAASVANPSVITTSAAHGFTNGQTVVITGDTTSVPTINGSWLISNVLGASFTIPLNVTTASSGAAATVYWTDTTVPMPVQAATLIMLAHLDDHRGDDMTADAAAWEAVANLCRRHRDPALA